MLTNTALLFASSATQPRRPLQLINESSQPHFDPVAPQQKSSKTLPLIQGNDMYTAIKSMQKELQVISRKVDILLSQNQVTKTSPLNFRPATNEDELEKLITAVQVQNELPYLLFCNKMWFE